MIATNHEVAQTAKRAGMISAGSLCCIVGAGLLTVSGWLLLVPLFGSTAAALILAGVYLGCGVILIAVGADNAPAAYPDPAAVKQPQAAALPMMQAFVFGVQAGSAIRKRRR